jgi:hypothetical protein
MSNFMKFIGDNVCCDDSEIAAEMCLWSWARSKCPWPTYAAHAVRHVRNKLVTYCLIDCYLHYINMTWGSHGGDYKDGRLLGCRAVYGLSHDEVQCVCKWRHWWNVGREGGRAVVQGVWCGVGCGAAGAVLQLVASQFAIFPSHLYLELVCWTK